jgi:hypothetical protein
MKPKYKSVERIYHPYWLWEDKMMYHPSGDKTDKPIKQAIKLLTNCDMFEETALEVTSKWKYACEHNLTNTGLNRIAYIGQVSCFYRFDVREDETRKAWSFLSDKQREDANNVADKVLRGWLDGQK